MKPQTSNLKLQTLIGPGLAEALVPAFVPRRDVGDRDLEFGVWGLEFAVVL
jgi:hypothetical protein